MKSAAPADATSRAHASSHAPAPEAAPAPAPHVLPGPSSSLHPAHTMPSRPVPPGSGPGAHAEPARPHVPGTPPAVHVEPLVPGRQAQAPDAGDTGQSPHPERAPKDILGRLGRALPRLLGTEAAAATGRRDVGEALRRAAQGSRARMRHGHGAGPGSTAPGAARHGSSLLSGTPHAGVTGRGHADRPL